MKKAFIPLFFALMLTGCDTPSSVSQEVNGNIVTFYLNTSSEDKKVYSTQIVNEGQKLLDPGSPKVKGFVFSGWYTDQTSKIKYTAGFDIEISSSFSLYAKWSDYSLMNEKEQVSLLLTALKDLSGNVSSSASVTEGTDTYAVAPDNPIEYYIKKDSTRYTDLTEVKYYNQSKEYTGLGQYFYDEKNFYNIYKDLSDKGAYSKKTTSAYSESKVPSFLNLDFENTVCYLLRRYRDSVLSDDYKGLYSSTLTGDPTLIDPLQDSYSFTFNLQEEFESEQVGTVDYYYETSYGLVFVNGKIVRSVFNYNYAITIQGEAQEILKETTTTSYTLTSSSYEEYEGTRLNPNDFTEAKK